MSGDGVMSGDVAAFQIRDFPVALRKAIVAEAALRGVTVTFFVTAQLTALYEAGWDRQTVLQNQFSNTSNELTPTLTVSDRIGLLNAMAALQQAQASMRAAGGRSVTRKLLAQQAVEAARLLEGPLG